MSLDGGKYVSSELPPHVSRETGALSPEAALVAVVIEQVEIASKYSGYIDRQKDDVQRAAHYENLKLPQDLDYMQVSALSIEARQKLNRHKPETLGQASRISGITPASVSLLTIHLKKTKFKGFVASALSNVLGNQDA
jgi:tRNA uridine 5-carboxymethylaminomethyl modification enzyme